MTSRRAQRGWLAAGLVAVSACGARPHTDPRSTAPTRITLYREHALIEQRVEVDVPASGHAVARATLPAGALVTEVAVLDRGGLVVSDARAAGAPPVEAGSGSAAPPADDADPFNAFDAAAPSSDLPPAATTQPTPIELDVTAPRAGHYALELAYTTTALTWAAAYTVTTTTARDRASLRGALAIENVTGVPFHDTPVAIVDDALDARRDQLAAALAVSGGRTTDGDPDKHPARAHALGRLDLDAGEVRIELFAPGATRALRSVLVYDPVGAGLDRGEVTPTREETYGVTPPPPHLLEAAELVRDPDHDLGLPAGPARLLEARPDGSLALLADGRLFDATTRLASFDVLTLGRAAGVTGRRRQRDLEIDDDRRRITEDFTIELTNQRAEPAEVVMLEHMYRGPNWALGFHSAPVALAGTQAISLRATVPAHGTASILYAVVYWWDEPK